MKFESSLNETIFISPITPEESYMFRNDLKSGLSIIWNRGEKASLMIDKQNIELNRDCIIFLTEFHKIDRFQFEKMNIIQFNRPFYCIENDDSEVGCRGLLFFGASDIPKIILQEGNRKPFLLLWEIMEMEMEESDPLKLEMLRVLLKRFLILCLRIYKENHYSLNEDNPGINLIREFNYLVEHHYKTLTTVAQYADLLNKSPKTLANIFRKYIRKTPLRIIQERRLLEAKRLLKYTDLPVQEIADELNFTDIQSFSHFFRTHEKLSPTQYRSL